MIWAYFSMLSFFPFFSSHAAFKRCFTAAGVGQSHVALANLVSLDLLGPRSCSVPKIFGGSPLN